MSAMVAATGLINQKNFDYELPGLGSVAASLFSSSAGTNTNSNSYIATLGKVIGVDIPAPQQTTAVGQIGAQAQLLTADQIATIQAQYGPGFNTRSSGAPDPYALLRWQDGRGPVAVETGRVVNGMLESIGLDGVGGKTTLARLIRRHSRGSVAGVA